MRTLSGMILAAALLLVVGCGKSEPPGEAKTDSPATTPLIPLGPEKDKTPTPAVPAAEWEMDLAKHAIPAAPVAGRLTGQAIAPEARFEGDTLSFRVLKDGNPERQLRVKLLNAKSYADGFKLNVNQDRPAGADIPEVMASFPPPKPGEPEGITYVNGYALTLELGKRDKDKLPGKIYLSLPGEGKDFLAGTFVAEWIRPASEPPGPDDVPFVQGKITAIGTAADVQVKVGYAAEPKLNEFALDVVVLPFVSPGLSSRSDFSKPRVTTFIAAEAAGKAASYEHTRLAAGRYLIFAAIDRGPAVWKWIVVPADGRLTLDFELDAGKIGGLEVTVPEGVGGKVQVAPADDAANPISPGLATSAAFALALEADVKNRGVKFEKLTPGKYEVWAGDLSATVEVKLNEIAKVELKKK